MKIVCTNVQQLKKNTKYYISFQIFLPWEAGESDLDSDFSKVTIKTITNNIVDTNELFEIVNIAENIKTKNNRDY